MNLILSPAIALMGRLPYLTKFIGIFLTVAIPMLIGSYQLVSPINAEIAFLKDEQAGLAYIKSVRQPIEHIQQHRGMVAAYLGGETDFHGRITKKRSTVDNKLAELKQMNNKLGGQFDTGSAIGDIERQWNNIKTNSLNMTAAASVKAHTTLIAGLLSLTEKVADSSQITLDPALDSYYMGNTLVVTLPNLMETMGQTRAVGASVAAEGKFENQEIYKKLVSLSNNINLYFKKVSSSLDIIDKNNAEVGKNLNAVTDSNRKAIHKIQALLNNQLINAESITVSSKTVFDASTAAISMSYELYDALASELDGLFIARIESNRTSKMITISVVTVLLVLIAWLSAGFYFSVRQSIAQINDAADKLAKGDLTAHVVLTSRDEMNQIADSFNTMADSFAQVVSQISGSSQQIGSSSESLSTITEQSRQNISDQQSQTEKVATAMEEMTATVNEVSSNIADTAQAAEKANAATAEGRQIVEGASQAVQTLAKQIENAAAVIHQLEKDSENINTVLEVIKGVAEQTNLLSLNAAIEAARAGEQGRGFAVVADEVRTLASRTQESTAEINQVIEKLQTGSRKAVEVMNQSTVEAQQVIEQTTKAGASLSTISSAVERINDMSNQIASAAEQQNVTAEEINRNISDITNMANKTSSGANQTASSSEELAQLGTELQTLVTQFKI